MPQGILLDTSDSPSFLSDNFGTDFENSPCEGLGDERYISMDKLIQSIVHIIAKIPPHTFVQDLYTTAVQTRIVYAMAITNPESLCYATPSVVGHNIYLSRDALTAAIDEVRTDASISAGLALGLINESVQSTPTVAKRHLHAIEARIAPPDVLHGFKEKIRPLMAQDYQLHYPTKAKNLFRRNDRLKQLFDLV